MLFKSSASPKGNPGSKRLRRTLGLLLGSALAVQYKQDRIFRASVNLQLVMVLNYLYAAYNLLTALQSGSVWLLSLGIYTLMLAIVRTDLTLSHHRGRKLPPDALPRHESRCYRRVAWSLLALNVPIGGLTLLMVSGQSVSALPGHLIYLLRALHLRHDVSCHLEPDSLPQARQPDSLGSESAFARRGAAVAADAAIGAD